ncbi:MAG: hypothetical protein AAFU71_15210, partial [Cyanobacteria bacterium J06632_22]
VTPTGTTAVLEDAAFLDPNGTGQQRNRPALAQAFEVTDSNNDDFGEVFNVVVNHFKSKGRSGLDASDTNNPDVAQGDGQGFWNDTRADAADYLVNTWIPTDPTGSGDADYLIIGDLNAYKGEDPIQNITDAGYADLIEQFEGDDAYSFVFDGQLGYLDYALSNATLTPQVVDVAEWHINADEINLFDYNNAVREGNERDFEVEPNGNNLFEVNAFRTSDHDPVIIGLDLSSDNGNGAPFRLGLIDATTDTLIQVIDDGDEINTSAFTNGEVSLTLLESDSEDFFAGGESAQLILNNGVSQATENFVPYALFGDVNADFNGGSLPVGANTLTAEVFTENQLGGASVGTLEVDFTIV